MEFVLNILKRVALVAAVTLTVFTVGATFSARPAMAVPSSKLEQAKAVKKEIDALDVKVERAAEKYNEARERLSAATTRRKKSEAKLATTNERLAVAKAHLEDRASVMYKDGPEGFLEVLLGATTFDEFATTWDILRSMTEKDAALAEELKVLRKEQKALTADLKKQEKIAKDSAAAMKNNKESIEKQLANRKAKLSGLEAEISQLEAQEEARRAASAPTKGTSSGQKKFPAPTRGARSEVVSIAKRYLGAPYRWAATGPNSFDCSGLTMFVYRQVGVSLPHSSRAQINVGQRVSRGDLQPGDLVFFGSPIHHVGIYVGGNQYLHSPQTGDVVKISSMNRSGYAGATRP